MLLSESNYTQLYINYTLEQVFPFLKRLLTINRQSKKDRLCCRHFEQVTTLYDVPSLSVYHRSVTLDGLWPLLDALPSSVAPLSIDSPATEWTHSIG